MDQLGALVTVEESRELGAAAVAATLRAAEQRTAAVIDSTWYPYSLPLVGRLPGPFVEVHCRLDVARAKGRFLRRETDPRHLGVLRTDAELWSTDVAALGVGPLVEVDTFGPVDIASVAELVRTSRKA